MSCKFYSSLAKGLKLKVRKIGGKGQKLIEGEDQNNHE